MLEGFAVAKPDSRVAEWTGLTTTASALVSAARRSAEEWVTEDWAAVATVIDQRMAELDMSQRELIERAQVSKAIVGELQNNSVQRRRSARTLEALSLALELHPHHLSAVLTGDTPPEQGEPATVDLPTRLDAIERHLRRLTRQMDSLSARLDDMTGKPPDDQ
jgi:transcriptional regulator with XRE-family HTH domain